MLNISNPTGEATLEQARKICYENNFDVHLVRDVAENDLLLYERSTDQVMNLYEYEVISETTPILEALEVLIEYPQVFVKEKRKVTKIISCADLDSVPVRIWLFGMINILEVELRNRIISTKSQWQQYLSVGRLEKATDLFTQKQERNEEVELLNCLQITDLSSVVLK